MRKPNREEPEECEDLEDAEQQELEIERHANELPCIHLEAESQSYNGGVQKHAVLIRGHCLSECWHYFKKVNQVKQK